MLRHIWKILSCHKLLTSGIGLLLFLLLVRIPFGTFNQSSAIDAVGHVILPALAAPLLYVVLVRLGYLPRLGWTVTIIAITMLGVSLEVVWEIFEFYVDMLFLTNWQVSNTDTMQDIISAVIGSLVGGLLYGRVYDMDTISTVAPSSSPAAAPVSSDSGRRIV